MNIAFDETKIQEALNSAATKAISDALSGYSAERALSQIVSESVLPEMIRSALTEAASRVDLEALTQALAAQIARTITSSAVLLMRTAAIGMIVQMRGVPSYDRDAQAKARAEVSRELGCSVPNEPDPLSNVGI